MSMEIIEVYNLFETLYQGYRKKKFRLYGIEFWVYVRKTDNGTDILYEQRQMKK